MLVKIVSDDESWSEGFECKKYRLVKSDNGIFLRLDDGPTLHEVSNSAVYVMNEEGKTIDRLR